MSLELFNVGEIPTGPAGPVAWDPDNHVWTDVVIAGRAGLWPYGAQGIASPTAFTPGSWVDVAAMTNAVVLPIGAYLVWSKVIVQDTSGTSTNQIGLRVCNSDATQILSEAMCTPPANGYDTLNTLVQLWTPGGVTIKLQVFGTAAGQSLGPGAGALAGRGPVLIALHLSELNIGGP